MSLSHLYGGEGEAGAAAAAAEEEVELERFEITDWDLQNEFNPNRQRHWQTKEEAVYGIWAERDSDDERPSFGGKRCGGRGGDAESPGGQEGAAQTVRGTPTHLCTSPASGTPRGGGGPVSKSLEAKKGAGDGTEASEHLTSHREAFLSAPWGPG